MRKIATALFLGFFLFQPFLPAGEVTDPTLIAGRTEYVGGSDFEATLDSLTIVGHTVKKTYPGIDNSEDIERAYRNRDSATEMHMSYTAMYKRTKAGKVLVGYVINELKIYYT
ncbi:MAG: hypothetical protein QNK37_14790 [Acidobacteriota bacterium]|nr:hypothetical protein [Acidobacteriota bacterium]